MSARPYIGFVHPHTDAMCGGREVGQCAATARVLPATSRSASSKASQAPNTRIGRHLHSLRRTNLDKHGVADASGCVQHNTAPQRLRLSSYQSPRRCTCGRTIPRGDAARSLAAACASARPYRVAHLWARLTHASICCPPVFACAGTTIIPRELRQPSCLLHMQPAHLKPHRPRPSALAHSVA